jgi:hypothetical protein
MARPDCGGTGTGGLSRSPCTWKKIGEGEPLRGGVTWHSTDMRSNEFDSNSNLKRIQIIFKFVQTLTAQKKTFPGLKIFK